MEHCYNGSSPGAFVMPLLRSAPRCFGLGDISVFVVLLLRSIQFYT